MDAKSVTGSQKARSILVTRETPAEAARRLETVMPSDLGLCWRNEFTPARMPVSVTAAIAALDGLARQFQELAVRSGNVRHLLVWREPESNDFRRVMPTDVERGTVQLDGEFAIHHAWSDRDRNLLGYVFGGTLDGSLHQSLLDQAGGWASVLFAGSPIRRPVQRWLLELHQRAWRGHPILRSELRTRIDSMGIPYGPPDRLRKACCLMAGWLSDSDSMPRCWYSVLRPDVYTASAMAIRDMIDSVERAVERSGGSEQPSHGGLVSAMRQPIPIQKAKAQLGDANLHRKLKQRRINVRGRRGQHVVDLEDLLAVAKPRHRRALISWANENYPPRSDW
ncbi:MAG: hypothetical protein AB7G11_17375 [Phycisphaerales bacterium]